MKTFMCAQYSPEWWTIRRGVPTASEFDRIMTPKKRTYSAGAGGYIAQLIADTACLNPNFFTDRPQSRAMADGINNEPEARRYYELIAEHHVQQVGFCLTDDGRFGCSPDGLVGDDGGLELKCPQLNTQAKYLVKGELPLEYMCQVHGQLIVTGRKWWDFLSYAPGLAPLLVRVEPNDFTDLLRVHLERFWTQYQETKAKILPEPPTPIEVTVENPWEEQGVL